MFIRSTDTTNIIGMILATTVIVVIARGSQFFRANPHFEYLRGIIGCVPFPKNICNCTNFHIINKYNWRQLNVSTPFALTLLPTNPDLVTILIVLTGGKDDQKDEKVRDFQHDCLHQFPEETTSTLVNEVTADT
jgi:hypothetical protein